MSRLLTLLTLMFLTSLACSVSAHGTPAPTPNAPKALVRSTPNELVTAEVTADEALHVRKEPLGTVLGYVYHGDTVTILACRDGWAQIEWQGGTAWVNADWLSDNTCKE
jgi:uncharacterized protein YgiM (DUF1202 family)